MSAIRGKDTKPELLLRRSLHAAGLRYRLHVQGLPGKPDLVFPSQRAVIFVNGCFWHRHKNCRFASTPKTRVDFWEGKFLANVRRDAQNKSILFQEGWRVAVVWECALKTEMLARIVEMIKRWFIDSELQSLEIDELALIGAAGN